MELQGHFFGVAVMGFFVRPFNPPYDTCRMCACVLALFDLVEDSHRVVRRDHLLQSGVPADDALPAETPLFCTPMREFRAWSHLFCIVFY